MNSPFLPFVIGLSGIPNDPGLMMEDSKFCIKKSFKTSNGFPIVYYDNHNVHDYNIYELTLFCTGGEELITRL